MDLNLIKSVGIKYEVDYLETGNYKLYHSDIHPNNLLSEIIFTEQDFYNGITIYKQNFPESLIFILENNLPYSFVLEKI